MKRLLCVFLACLLVTASFAMAEGTAQFQYKPIELEENPLQLGNCINAAGDKYIIRGMGEPNGKIGIMITNYSDPSQVQVRRDGNRATADINSEGKWELEIPVLKQNGEDAFSSLGDISSVHLWAWYIIGGSKSDQWPIGELIRMSGDALQDEPAKQDAADAGENEFYVFEPEAEWGLQTLSFRILVNNGEASYGKKNVTLRVKGDKSNYVSAKTDEDGNVTFNLSDKMWKVGTQLELVNDKNQKVIVEYTIPKVAEQTQPQTQATAEPTPTKTPEVTAALNLLPNNGEVQSSEPSTLLSGLAMPLVYILCAVFLVGYVVCWIGVKYPEKFGGSRKRGV